MTPAIDVEPALLGAHRALVAEHMQTMSLPLATISGRMVAYHMGWVDRVGRPEEPATGKFIRPSLCLWACVACGGKGTAAISAAASLEWLHNFTLVHDDIQDGDRQRRNRETVWSIWGVGQGINAGDALALLAFKGFAADPLHPERSLRALQVIVRSVIEVIEGQCLDLELEGHVEATLRTYLRMVQAKTGALIGASLEAGAAMAGATAITENRFRRAGRLLGTAFQMRDDWLGIWGDPVLTGKSRSTDAARRKLSFPVVAAYAAMNPAQRRRLRELFAAHSGDVVTDIHDLLADVGGPELTRALPQRFAEKAIAVVAGSGVARESLAEFEEFAHYVANRSR
ncbi:MAG: polyprenyl synthetase family protein [Vulcanimicrobiaceae bacterium]